MQSRSGKRRLCMFPFLVLVATVYGCQSTHYASIDAAVADGRSKLVSPRAVRGTIAPNAARQRSRSVTTTVHYDDNTPFGDSGRSGAPVNVPRLLTLASYREAPLPDGSAESSRSPAPGNHLTAGGRPSRVLSLSSYQDQPSEDKAATASSDSAEPTHQGHTLAEINNKLNNPGADLAQLQFKFNWTQYQGSLGGNRSLGAILRGFRKGNPIKNLLNLGRMSGEGASSQNELTLDFQPVFPFKLKDGGHFIIRPTIPMVWKPYYDQRSNGFENQFGLGDAQLVGFYSRTDAKKGTMWGVGMTTQFPTHTDDVLGNDAFMMGPAGFVGLFGKWGSAGLFPQHWWNIGGGDGYTSLTALQPWYWFNVGKGYQIGGSPVITYNWANDDSDNNLTVPANLGVAKVFKFGKLPVKIKFEGIYYTVQPDEFGPQWGIQLTLTPVIPNPFEKHGP